MNAHRTKKVTAQRPPPSLGMVANSCVPTHMTSQSIQQHTTAYTTGCRHPTTYPKGLKTHQITQAAKQLNIATNQSISHTTTDYKTVSCGVVWCGVVGYRAIWLPIWLVEWCVGCLARWVFWPLGLFVGCLACWGMLCGVCTLWYAVVCCCMLCDVMCVGTHVITAIPRGGGLISSCFFVLGAFAGTVVFLF